MSGRIPPLELESLVASRTRYGEYGGTRPRRTAQRNLPVVTLRIEALELLQGWPAEFAYRIEFAG